MNKNYFDPENYSDGHHWHIECLLNGRYVEAIAFQRKTEKSWDIFFQDFESESERMIFKQESRFYDENFGVFIFKAEEYDVESKFKEWVNQKLISIRNDLKNT